MNNIRTQSNELILINTEKKKYAGFNAEENQEFTNLCIQIDLLEVRGCGKFGYQKNFAFKLIDYIKISAKEFTLTLTGEELLNSYNERALDSRFNNNFTKNNKENLEVEFKKDPDSILKKPVSVIIPITATYLNNLPFLPSLLKNKSISIEVSLRDISYYSVYDEVMKRNIENVDDNIIKSVKFIYDTITSKSKSVVENKFEYFTQIEKKTMSKGERDAIPITQLTSLSSISRFEQLTNKDSKVLFYPESFKSTEESQFIDNIKNSLIIVVPKNMDIEEYIKKNFDNCNKKDFILVNENGEVKVKKNHVVKVNSANCTDYNIYYHNNIISFNRNESELPQINLSDYIKEIDFIRMDNGVLKFLKIINNIPSHLIHVPLDMWEHKYNISGKDKRSIEDKKKFLYYKNPYHFGIGDNTLINKLQVQQGINKIFFNQQNSTDKIFNNTALYTSNNVVRGDYEHIFFPIANFNTNCITGKDIPQYLESNSSDNCDKLVIDIQRDKKLLGPNSPLNLMNIQFDIFIEKPVKLN